MWQVVSIANTPKRRSEVNLNWILIKPICMIFNFISTSKFLDHPCYKINASGKTPNYFGGYNSKCHKGKKHKFATSTN